MAKPASPGPGRQHDDEKHAAAVLSEQREVGHHAHADRDEQQGQMGEHEVRTIGHRFAHRGKVKTGEQQHQADHRAGQGQRQAA